MDLDFNTIERDGVFQIELSNRTVSGNRNLVNRFEICFLTELRVYENNNQYQVDNFGGNAYKYISQSYVLNDLSTISGGISIAIENTVTSLKNNEIDSMPDTEKISSASLIDLIEEGGMVYASIDIVPVEIESYSIISLKLPITKKED